MTDTPDRLIPAREVCQILSISRSAFYEGIHEGRFPPPIKFGPRTSRWRLSEVHALIDETERNSRLQEKDR